MSTDLPRTIEPSELLPGDGVEVKHTRSGLTQKWTGVVSAVAPTSFTLCNDTVFWFGSWGAARTLTLLSRPKPPAPPTPPQPSVLDAEMGAQFQCRDMLDRPYGRWVRTNSTEPAFRSLMGEYADIAADSSSVTRLIPYSAPLSELDTLRQNVIDAANLYSRTAGRTSYDLLDAVRALRGAEANRG